MREIEHNIQCACVRWFRYQYPEHIIYAIPNGGARNVIVASKMKAEGVLAGVPDLCVPIARQCYNALYIEMKNGKKGVLSDNQKKVIEKLEESGNKVVVCRSFDDFMKEITNYINLTNK